LSAGPVRHRKERETLSIQITITHVTKDGGRTSEQFAWEGGLVQFAKLAEDFSQYPKSLAQPLLAARDDRGPDVLLSDGTRTRDWIAEGRLVRNVIAALRRALAEHAEGCRESSLWHGVEACGVARSVFDEAIEIMLNTGWSCRRYDRLFSGAAPMGKPHRADEKETKPRRGWARRSQSHRGRRRVDTWQHG
jgi:hypothetical protein